MVWIWVDMLRPTVLYLVFVYFNYDSWVISMDVARHLLRCGLAVVLRCQGLSKVRCSEEGLVLHGVWQVLESAKDLFLGVDPTKRTCATMCSVWNDLLNKLVQSGTCLAGGMGYMFKCVTLGICKVQSARVKCVMLTHCSMTGMGFKCVTP
jgi:hypothetical protein